jgi:4-hydroxybenzoyl-CoA thioesterase
MIYHRLIRIEFNHCDPAGIVFYPRYFEMLNSTVENFFRDEMAYPFEVMMGQAEGVPTARTEVTFHAPSRLGEELDWQLSVVRLGRASVGLTAQVWCGDSHRLTADLTLVFVRDLRPQAWPDTIRSRLIPFMEAPHDP